MKIVDTISAIDFKLLREQKAELVGSIGVLDDLGYSVVKLNGILHTLDAIQDAVVEQGLATEEEVFGITK